MITNNFKKMMAYTCLGGTYATFQQSVVSNYGSTINGYPPGSSYFHYLQPAYILKCPAVRIAAGTVCFGNGSVPPSAEDYKLSGDIITGLTFSTSVVATPEDDGVTLTATYTVTNSNSQEITISEVAMFGTTYSSNGYADSNFIMLDRTVLDDPVTIPAGGFGQVVYTVKMNYPI